MEPAVRQVMTCEASTGQIRPFVACAVLRGVQFDKLKYKSFIDLQDKLHQNICRRRTYVAIGTHDLDTIKGPFRYQALKPEDINFVPLTAPDGKVFNSKQLLDHYRTDPSCKHLKPYTDIIYDSPVYPVIYDSAGTVLSLPPIINGHHSRIQLHTQNVFIECTGTDLTKVNIVLDTMVTMFAEHCAVPFTVEPVDVRYECDGKQYTTPLLSTRTCDASVKDINGTIGIRIAPEKMVELCSKMQLGPASYIAPTSGDAADEGTVRVTVPPTRSDILHAVDVIEDVAIAYGYNNIPLEVPNTLCFGAPLPVNHFTDLLRAEIARAGFSEMLTHGLCSTAENFTHLRRPLGPAAALSNPANVEYEVVRTTLIPGALKTLSFNKSLSHRDGIRLFEINDVVLMDDQDPIGARNARRLVALSAAHSSDFEVIHGLADRVMTCVQIKPEKEYASSSLSVEQYRDRERVARPDICYYIRASEDPLFFDGMKVELVLQYSGALAAVPDKVVGTMGVVHPEVLSKFEVTYPTSLVELDIDALM